MRALVLDSTARKGMDGLPDKQFRQVVSAIFALLKEPRPADSLLLSGFPYYRISVGGYRVIYDFTEAEIRIVAFGKRNDDEVYKRLKRKG